MGPFFYLPSAEMQEVRLNRLEEIARFGIPGTDMAGHEYLTGRQVASIGLWLSQNVAKPHPSNEQHIPSGAKP